MSLVDLRPKVFLLALAVVLVASCSGAGTGTGTGAGAGDASVLDANSSGGSGPTDGPDTGQDASDDGNSNDVCDLAPGTYAGHFTESNSLSPPEKCPAVPDHTVTVAASQGTAFLDSGASCTTSATPEACGSEKTCASPPDAQGNTLTKLFFFTVANGVLSGTVNYIVKNENGTVLTNCRYVFGYIKS